jgi:5-methylthioadenosine/S-adenosylhomocysteine deaminase
MKILISGGTVFTINPAGTIHPRADVYIQDGVILAVNPQTPPFEPSAADEYIDATGCNVLPGFVNAHGHLALALFRGLGEFVPGLPGDQYFAQQAAMAKKLTLEDYYLGAQCLLVEMISAGITSFADINYEGPFSPPIIDAAAQAVEIAGIRAVMCLEAFGFVNDTGTHLIYNREEFDRSLLHSLKFANKWHKRANGKITAMLGLGIPPAPKQYDLEQLAKTARESGYAIQMHVAEMTGEMEEWWELYASRPPEILRQTGILEHHILGGNVIYLNADDARLLRDYPFYPSTCPKNCCKMVLGMLDIPLMLANGIQVCLGTNEVVNNNNTDMIEEMRMAAFYHKAKYDDPSILWGDMPLRMITEYGGKALATGVGVLETGRPADVIVMDKRGAHMQPAHDPLANLIYSSASADTRHSIIAGKMVMKDRKILTFDASGTLDRLCERIQYLQQFIPQRQPILNAKPRPNTKTWTTEY